MEKSALILSLRSLSDISSKKDISTLPQIWMRAVSYTHLFVCRYGAEYLFRKEWFDALDANEIGGVYLCGLEVERSSGDLLIDYLEEHPEFSLYFAPGPRIGSIPSERLERLFRLSPLVHLNASEALTITGCNNLHRAVKVLCSITNGGPVIITLGARGVLCAQGDWMEEVPAQAVEVEDTIGAGDSHIGAMIAGLSRGDVYKRQVIDHAEHYRTLGIDHIERSKTCLLYTSRCV